MVIQQISLFMENTTGRLAEVTELLAKAGINLRALTIADTADFGILRIIADKPIAALRLLKEAGMTAKETDVIGVEVPDNPGELAKVMQLFADAEINIEYLYASLERCADKAVIIFKINEVHKGLAMLKSKGYQTLKAI